MDEKNPLFSLVDWIQADLSNQIERYQRRSWQAYYIRVSIHLLILIVLIGLLIFGAWIGFKFGSKSFKQLLSAFLIFTCIVALFLLVRNNLYRDIQQRVSDTTRINIIILGYIYQIIELEASLIPRETTKEKRKQDSLTAALEKLNQVTADTLDLIESWMEDVAN